MDDMARRKQAGDLIGRLDLTNLNDDCTVDDVAALCLRAVTPAGPVAAICVWPRFVAYARQHLVPGIRIATVVNFPAGGEDVAATLAETERAIADGADEIDMVIAYRRLPNDAAFVQDQVRQIKAACGSARLKTILEAGEIRDPDAIRIACRAALGGGADFLKTSTGKTAESATPASARLLLGAIADSGREAGFKAAGGIKTFEDAQHYLELAEAICGIGWATPERFRLGASGVLGDLLAVFEGREQTGGKAGY